MAIVLIDGRELEIRGDERLNAIQAAARLGIEIPHYCWHPALSVVGSCRMCLIETGQRDAKTGRIDMFPKLMPACNTIVRDGTVLVTQSEKVARARAMVEEDLLLRHPIDCPICDKAGECLLQDYHFRYGQAERRADLRPFSSRRRDVGENVTLFVDRCITCSRCVRFGREVTGSAELMLLNRGAYEEIDVLDGFPLANKLSGNVVDLCPVGALGDKDFLYRQRVWFLRRHAGVCTGCATGCSTWIEENQDRVWRIKPRENPRVNTWWICNDGRYDYPHVHCDRRILRPRGGTGSGGTGCLSASVGPSGGTGCLSASVGPSGGTGCLSASGGLEGIGKSGAISRKADRALADKQPVPPEVGLQPVPPEVGLQPVPPEVGPDWSRLPRELDRRLREAGRLAALVSPMLTVEEAYLLARYLRGIDPEALLALGPVPKVGEDERFPGGFTIAAEKAPNRRGVEEVVAHFMRRVPTLDDVLAEADGGNVRGLWVAGAYRKPWIDQPTAGRLGKLGLVIVQDLFESPLSELAVYVLPATAFAERDGSYVNRHDHLQSVRRAIRPPAGVRSEGSLLWELSGRQGLYDAPAVLAELATEISYFRAAARGVPEGGVQLKINLLA